MKRCQKCGEVNWSPYKISNKKEVCTKCGSELDSGSCRPMIGSSDIVSAPAETGLGTIGSGNRIHPLKVDY